MKLLNYFQELVLNYLNALSIEKYQSTMGWHDAPKYAKYLDYCKRQSPRINSNRQDIKAAASEFLENGVVSFRSDQTIEIGKTVMASIQKLEKTKSVWREAENSRTRMFFNDQFQELPIIGDLFLGDIGDLLRSIYGCEFKIFYAKLDKYLNIGEPPIGSSLWHIDGGPGTCINLLFYPDGASKEQGAIEILPWNISKDLIIQVRKIFRTEMCNNGNKALDRTTLRNIKCDFFKKEIEEKFLSKVQQPTSNDGMFVLFRNNCVHKGGHPDPGYERYASIFHCYPSNKAPDIDSYILNGCRKSSPYPKDPTF